MTSNAPDLRINETEFFILTGPKLGDVSLQSADVLVSSTGTDAKMRVGVSNAIRRRGGDEIETELRARLPYVPGDVVITDAGHLPAKRIYHAIVVNWSDASPVLQASVWRVVARCITRAQTDGFASIAFPSLGTGRGHADAYETLSTMMAACLDSLQPSSSLKRISFCFLESTMERFCRTALLQQGLIRRVHSMVSEAKSQDPVQREQLAKDLNEMWPAVMSLTVNVTKLAALVARLENSGPATIINIGNIINSTDIAIGSGAQATRNS